MEEHKKIQPSVNSYECEIFRKEFSLYSSLARHKRIHTGEKPFQCKICKKAFSANGSLTRHVRVHTGEKPYSCELCKKGFNNKSDLTRHRKVHTGEKPFSCDVCQKSFAAYSSTHNKTAAHIKRMKSKNTNLPLNPSSFIDCGRTIKEEYIIKVEDIKEEIKEEESADVESNNDPLNQEIDVCEVFFEYDKFDMEESGLEPNSFANIEPDYFDINVNNTHEDNSFQDNAHSF